MLPRVPKLRLIVSGGFCLVALILFLHSTFVTDAKIRLSKSSQRMINNMHEFLGLAEVEKCPLCFGEEFCEELAKRKISSVLYQDVHQVFGEGGKVLYWLRPLASNPLNNHAMNNFESYVCRNATKTVEYREVAKTGLCDYSKAASVGFMRTADVGSDFIRDLFRAHLVSRRRIPMTACPSWKLIQGLIQSFDVDEDRTLSAAEKAHLIASLAGNPDLAVNRFVKNQNVPIPFVNFYGSCGKFAAFEPMYKRLDSYLDQDLAVRKNLAAQTLKLVDNLLNEDQNWLLFTTQVTLDNLIVTNSGEVAFLDLSQMLLIDRDLLDHDRDEAQYDDCGSSDCLQKMYEKMITADKPDECFKAKQISQLMYVLVCKNVLSDMETDRESRPENEKRGFLHSISNEDEMQEINGLLEECIDETEKNGRIEAAMNLMELLRAEFVDDDEENEDTDEAMDQDHEVETGGEH